MQSLSVLAILGFASYRATQFGVYDSLLDGQRTKLELWHAARIDSKWRTFWRDLVACTYCLGFWCSSAIVLTYLTATGQWGAAPLWVHAIELWAVAGVQALLNKWDS